MNWILNIKTSLNGITDIGMDQSVNGIKMILIVKSQTIVSYLIYAELDLLIIINQLLESV